MEDEFKSLAEQQAAAEIEKIRESSQQQLQEYLMGGTQHDVDALKAQIKQEIQENLLSDLEGKLNSSLDVSLKRELE